MIYETLHILKEQVDNYLKSFDVNNSLILGNVSMLDNENEDLPDSQMKNTNVLTLINIEEEITLKNGTHQVMKNNQAHYKNRPVNLNLYLLFSANKNSYDFSLQSLSKIIEFFQGKNVFTHSNTIYTKPTEALNNLKEFKFSVDLYTPTFEEMNYIWGTLGGKQLPSAMYKVSLINIQRESTFAKQSVITEINGTLN